MGSERYDRLQSVFVAARDLPPAERGAFIEAKCHADPSLRAEVQELLSQDKDATGFLSPAMAPAVLAAAAVAGQRLSAGTRVGPYELQSVIGEGGFGIVYAAERLDPFVQRVAIKVIKPGMDSRAVIARFEQERQTLAVMNHGSVARVLDGGLTPQGLPYFVMEHVEGRPITEYCDHERLDLCARLRLFIAVCDAVQHAHTKGVVHRDLKPSNILVSVIDGQPIPKVIDFGIAKAMATGPGTATQTLAGQVVGTPAYMSPEQFSSEAGGVDTRSDVYSLGVLLYELLTGVRPFEADSSADLAKLVCGTDSPVLPSRRVTAGSVPKEAADLRATSAATLARTLREDLDWVVLRAIARDREHRYTSPADLGADLRRFLAGESVVARPPTLAYQAAKLARRHKGPVTGAIAALASIVAGGGIATWMAVREARAARTAERFNIELLRETASSARRASQWPRVIEAADRALSLGAPDELGWKLRRIEALDALDRLTETRREIRDLENRGDLAAYEPVVWLWRAEMELSSQAFWADDAETVSLLHRAQAFGTSEHWGEADQEYIAGLLAPSWPEAADHFLAVVRLDPARARAGALLGISLALSGQLEEAVSRLRAMQVYSHPLPGPQIVLSAVLSMTGRRAEAKEVLRSIEASLGAQKFRAAGQLVDAADGLLAKNPDSLDLKRVFRLYSALSRLCVGDEKDADGQLARDIGLRAHPLLRQMAKTVQDIGPQLTNLAMSPPKPAAGTLDERTHLISKVFEPCGEAMAKFSKAHWLVQNGKFEEAIPQLLDATHPPALINVMNAAWADLMLCYSQLWHGRTGDEARHLMDKFIDAAHRSVAAGGPLQVYLDTIRTSTTTPEGLRLAEALADELRWRYPEDIRVARADAELQLATGAYRRAEMAAEHGLAIRHDDTGLLELRDRARQLRIASEAAISPPR